MLTFDATTTAALNLAASKLAWCEIIATALGETGRTLVCKRAASGDAWATGTVFRDLDMTGAISTAGAVLSSLGVTSNARVQLAADLTTGVSVWRISNAAGTRWMQGTLGAIGSGADVERTNPTATSGDDFAGVTIKPPAVLPSGTGPASPALTSTTPKTWVLMDYSGETPVEVGRQSFTVRDNDLVYEHPLMASENGDVQIWMCPGTLIHGQIEFGAILVRAGAHCTVSGAKPLERVMVAMKPTTWTGYPRSDTYDKATMLTYAPAFKILILNDNDEPCVNWEGYSAIEMHDHLPVNDKSFPQDEFYDPSTGTVASPIGSGPKWGQAGVAVRPHVNSAMVLQWLNEMPCENKQAKYNWFNGLDELSAKPYNARKQATCNPLNQRFYPQQQNGAGHLFAMDRWPQPSGFQERPLPIDPAMANPNSGSAAYTSRQFGWGDEPGAIGDHSHYTGPGGASFNRSALPSVMAMFYTDPEGVRPEGAAPWRRMAVARANNQFNRSHHFIGNVATFEGAIPKAETNAAQWVASAQYYGNGGIGPKSVMTLGAGNGVAKYAQGSNWTPAQISLDTFYDSTGRHPWGFYLWETNLHGHDGHAGINAAFLNDPSQAILQRFSYDGWSYGLLGARYPTVDAKSYFAQRMHAWRWYAYWNTWICASNHRLTYSRAEVEARMQTELMQLYTDVWVPAYTDNNQDIYFAGIRKLGRPATYKSGATYLSGYGDGGNLFMYMGQVAHLWKVTGLWDVVKSWGIAYERVLEMVVRALDVPSIDWILATNGRISNNRMSVASGNSSTLWTADDIPNSWAEFDAAAEDTGLADWMRDSAGNIIWDETSTQHMNPQWISIRQQWFTDYPNANAAAAAAVYQGFYEERDAIAVGASNPGNAGWGFRIPSHGCYAALAVEE